jgi:hypothetical protein
MTNLDEIDEDLIRLARPTYTEIEFPTTLWSEVAPGLWQGGTDDDDTIFELKRSKTPFITKEDFDTVITAYAWANPCDWGVKEVRYCFYDGNMSDMDFEALDEVVNIAYNDWKAGKQVLIRCQAGLNRSGLIMAKILMKDGYTADEAIALIRANRSEWALFNKTFEKWLKSIKN